MKRFITGRFITILFLFSSYSFAPREAGYNSLGNSERTLLTRPVRYCSTVSLDAIDVEAMAPIFPNMGDFSRKITTRSPLAQQYFDQGLKLIYGFNHMEAVRSFRQAVKIDPNCAMAWWGEAMALGPNINLPMSAENGKAALEAIQNASSLAVNVSKIEQNLIEALSTRYAADTLIERATLDARYAEAMESLAGKYPEDPDIRTLFADAVMNQMPWDYYMSPETPKPETKKVIEILESVIARHPRHPGAHHLYIHIVEPSDDPERGLPSADLLGNLVPASGHLVHMPSHIYIRTGYYKKAIETNLKAIVTDEDYIAHCQAHGVYPAGYYPHNIHFLYASSLFAGNGGMAVEAARKVVSKLPADAINDSHFTQEFLTAIYHAFVVFKKWNEMLTEPHPGKDHLHATIVWHYGRGLAFFAKNQISRARNELLSIETLMESDAFNEKYPGNSETTKVGHIAINMLKAQDAIEKEHIDEAINFLEVAKDYEDGLAYNEPATWSLPVRWVLGALYFKDAQYERAEKAFREDLGKNKENGFALYGLIQCIQKSNAHPNISDLQARMDNAWKWSDQEPSMLYF